MDVSFAIMYSILTTKLAKSVRFSASLALSGVEL